MLKLRSWFILVGLIALLTGVSIPDTASAEWPPFRFEIEPTHTEGNLIYTLKLSKQTDGPLTDLLIRLPLPEGTRFVEATAQASTSIDFDGQHITFFTATLHEPLRNANFTVEVTDPDRTEFTTQAWIAWKGAQPGDYLVADIDYDITKTELEWIRPRARLEVEAGATVADGIVTYTIYPDRDSQRRMWDLRVKFPLPPGTSLLSTAAPPTFTTDFDGQEVTFSTIEAEYTPEMEPFVVTVSTDQVTDPFLVTHAWAVWKNVGRGVNRRVNLQEDARSGDIVVQLNGPQKVTADPIGDVPFPTYDLTGIGLQRDRDGLRMIFYTAGDRGPVGDPIEYILYLDRDCQTATGAGRGNRGAEYWVRYKQTIDKAAVYTWDEVEQSWKDPQLIEVEPSTHPRMLTLRMSNALFEAPDTFCWIGRARNRSEEFTDSLRNEWVGQDPRSTVYDLAPTPDRLLSSTPDDDQRWGLQPLEASAPVDPAAPTGSLAVPLDNGRGGYDVHLFDVSSGQEILRLPQARQPHFHPAANRLLVNRDGGEVDAVYEYDLGADPTGGANRRVSDEAGDAHPVYDPWGNRVAYGNEALVVAADGNQQPFIFVQCGLTPPQQETEPRCRDIVTLGKLIPPGHRGELQGRHPVWTDDEQIAYRGCNSWIDFAQCGIYIVPSASTKGLSDGLLPRQLTDHTSDTPTDTHGPWITFHSQRESNWEAYVMDINGDRLRNLSNQPTANDGLPTISPDGQWVAFVSDRDGGWAIWAVPLGGGAAQKLFDLPAAVPWGDGARSWLTERIAWGP